MQNYVSTHELQTPNEGIPKSKKSEFGPMWQTKYALAVPKNLGVEVNFRPYSEGDFLTGRP